MSQDRVAVVDEDESDEALRIPRGMGRAPEPRAPTARSTSRGRMPSTLPCSTLIHVKNMSSLTPVQKHALPGSMFEGPAELAQHQFKVALVEEDQLRASIWAMAYQLFTDSNAHSVASFGALLSTA